MTSEARTQSSYLYDWRPVHLSEISPYLICGRKVRQPLLHPYTDENTWMKHCWYRGEADTRVTGTPCTGLHDEPLTLPRLEVRKGLRARAIVPRRTGCNQRWIRAVKHQIRAELRNDWMQSLGGVGHKLPDFLLGWGSQQLRARPLFGFSPVKGGM